jgi:hypothetical protein
MVTAMCVTPRRTAKKIKDSAEAEFQQACFATEASWQNAFSVYVTNITRNDKNTLNLMKIVHENRPRTLWEMYGEKSMTRTHQGKVNY